MTQESFFFQKNEMSQTLTCRDRNKALSKIDDIKKEEQQILEASQHKILKHKKNISLLDKPIQPLKHQSPRAPDQERIDSLYQEAFQRKEKISKFSQRVKEERVEQELEGCTFRPDIKNTNRYYAKRQMERVHKFGDKELNLVFHIKPENHKQKEFEKLELEFSSRR